MQIVKTLPENFGVRLQPEVSSTGSFLRLGAQLRGLGRLRHIEEDCFGVLRNQIEKKRGSVDSHFIRYSIEEQVEQLVHEMDRIAFTTEFCLK